MGPADERPWGRYLSVDNGDGYQVKRIEVLPGQRLSYQTHRHRAEHWFLVQGHGVVTLEGVEVPLAPGESIDVPLGAAHRMTNSGAGLLVFIEVQRGDYLGEDDIVRLSDDYGRVPSSSAS
ncbi:MAG: phosphomannose isomerase type II C-terminal cupin domain [Chloroflexi bacterium]|nr:phosphomannose isomerase type II C-terminal cupin domain [Chloroflexota bacterium]